MLKVLVLLSSLLSPVSGDFVCWYNSVTSPECGTYGWSTNKDKAKEVADDLCQKTCKTDCSLAYCEKLK